MSDNASSQNRERFANVNYCTCTMPQYDTCKHQLDGCKCATYNLNKQIKHSEHYWKPPQERS